MRIRCMAWVSLGRSAWGSRAFLFYIESMERLYGLVFAVKRMVKGAATLTSFALDEPRRPGGCL